MSTAAQGGLWALALAGSLVVHGAAGMALLAMPAPRAPEAPSTEITIASLPTATARALTPIEAAPTTATEDVAAVSEAPSDALQAVEEQAAPAAVDQVASAPIVDTLEAAAAPASQALAPSATPAQDLTPAAEAEAATANETQAPVMPVASATADADVAAAAEPVTPLAEARMAAPVESDRDAALSADAPAALAAAEPDSALPTIVVPADDVEQSVTLAPAAVPTVNEAGVPPSIAPSVGLAPSAGEANAAIEPLTPSSSAPAGAIAPVAPDAFVVTAPQVDAQPQAPAPAAPAASVPATASPTALAPVVEAPAGSSPALAPAGVTESPQIVEAIEDPPAAPAPEAAPAEQQLAMVVPDEPEAPPLAPPPPLADFLKGYEVPDCLLALPAGEAAVEVLSDSPAPVAALNARYEALAARPIAAERRPVTHAQCGSLSFARDIAAYPNYPLSITLKDTTIDSGAALSGAVAGLRKNTLYLMVIDDEGQAKLVESRSGISETSVAFTAPMTLTAGPVASAQLLVAIAADGALRTVASKTGMPADDYFAALRAEIIADQRPILFGIAAFSIR